MALGLKTGGRQKGTPNKLTLEIKSRLDMFLHDHWDGFIKDYQTLEPVHRVKVYEKLLSYAIPKDTNIETESAEPVIIHIRRTII